MPCDPIHTAVLGKNPQYIGEPHANGLLENATFEKVPETLTTDLELLLDTLLTAVALTCKLI